MIDIKISLQPLDQALSDVTEPIVFLFGAGISASLVGRNYSWEQWVRDGIASRRGAEVKVLRNTGRYSGQKGISLRRYAYVCAGSSGVHEGIYETWMHNAFEALHIEDKTLAKTLKRLLTFQDLFVTTNYDDLLKQATGTGAVSYVHPEVVYPMLAARRNTHIVHIHSRYSSNTYRWIQTYPRVQTIC